MRGADRAIADADNDTACGQNAALCKARGRSVGGFSYNRQKVATIVAASRVVVSDRVDGQCCRRLPKQAPANAIAVDVSIFLSGKIAGRSLTQVGNPGNPHCCILRQRCIDHALKDLVAKDRTGSATVGQLGAEAAAEPVRVRRIGGNVDHARRGGQAEQRALRPLQHFDAADVEQVGDVGVALTDLVNDDTDRSCRAW